MSQSSIDSNLNFITPPRKPFWRRVDWKRLLTLTAIAGVTAACVFGLIALTAYGYFAQSLPAPEKLAELRQAQSTKIFDRNGELLFEVFDPNAGRRTVVPIARMPAVLKQAVIATEDPSFYTNPGVDARGIARAIYYLVTTGKPSGGEIDGCFVPA